MNGLSHLGRVCAVTAVLLAIVFWQTGKFSDFRGDDALDFAALGPDDLVIDFALTRRQIGLLMFGYAEASGFRPQVGLFGNHQMQLFSSEAFGEAKDSGFFFNYWYANLGLPELRDQLYYFKAKQLLPAKLVLIHITTPNNDSCAHIIEYGSELPFDVRQFATTAYPVGSSHFGSKFVANLRWRLSYANFVRSVASGNRYWIIGPDHCDEGKRPPYVGCDQDWTASQPVHPYARDEAEEEAGDQRRCG